MGKMRKAADEDIQEFTVDDTEDDYEEAPSATDNAHKIPLFANADKRGIRSIAYLKLYKMEEKGWAYKGQLPLNSSLETIGQMYGDGLYTIEACNNKHKILDTMEAVRISLGSRALASGPSSALPLSASSDADRIERLATRAADETRELNNNYTKMVLSQNESAAAREREWMAGAQKQQSDFMQALLLQSQQGFQQMMALVQTSHTQTIQQLTAVHNLKDENKPNQMQMVEMMLKAIMVGRDLAGDGGEDEADKPIWEQILGGGVSILQAVANQGKPVGQLAAPVENPKRRKLSQKGQQVLAEALTLHKAIRNSGLTVADALEKLQPNPSVTPSAPDDDDEADDVDETDDDTGSESEDESDDDESGEFTPISGPN